MVEEDIGAVVGGCACVSYVEVGAPRRSTHRHAHRRELVSCSVQTDDDQAPDDDDVDYSACRPHSIAPPSTFSGGRLRHLPNHPV